MEKLINIGKINLILLEYGVETTNLWNNDEEKKFFLIKLFDYSVVNNFSSRLCKDLFISQDLYYKLLKEYNDTLPFEARHDIKMENGKINVTLNNHSKLKKIYDDLKNIKDETEVVNYFLRYAEEARAIIASFSRYKAVYMPDEIERILTNFSIYEKYYSEAVEERRERINREKNSTNQTNNNNKKNNESDEFSEKNRVDRATKIIKEYLKQKDYHIYPVLKKYDISKIKFRSYAETVMASNKQLYNQLKYKMKEVITIMSTMMNSDIKENDITRKFDLVDYLDVIDFEPNIVSGIAGKNSSGSLFKNFSRINEFSFRDEEDFEKKVFSEIRIFFGEFDKNNNYIEGTGRKITDEEKQKIIDYIDKKHYYKNQNVYNTLLRRYIKGCITFEEEKKLKKIKK